MDRQRSTTLESAKRDSSIMQVRSTVHYVFVGDYGRPLVAVMVDEGSTIQYYEHAFLGRLMSLVSSNRSEHEDDGLS